MWGVGRRVGKAQESNKGFTASSFFLPNLQSEDWIESVYLNVCSPLSPSYLAFSAALRLILVEERLQTSSIFTPSEACTKIKTTELLSSVSV